jgi:DNA-binding PadR family transcriptional regulator
MVQPKDIAKHLPLSETTCYIMLALVEPAHGYAVMQKVEVASEGTVKLGPGTLYGVLATLEKEKLIQMIKEEDRRKVYALTEAGKQVLAAQIQRMEIMTRCGLNLLSYL